MNFLIAFLIVFGTILDGSWEPKPLQHRQQIDQHGSKIDINILYSLELHFASIFIDF